MSNFSVAAVFGSGMVLQRDKRIAVWGEGDEGLPVTVTVGGAEAVATVKDGRWKCYLPPQKAAWGLTLTVRCCGEEISFRDVLFGDVYLAAGQSNMEFCMCYEKHWEEAQRLPKNPGIRMYNCPRLAFAGQIRSQPECGYWFDDRDNAWAKFSSAGYWFARYLQPEVNVPIGIIGCNWGGTSASAWVSEEDLLASPLNVYLRDYACAERKNGDVRAESLAGWAFLERPEHKAEVSRIMLGMTPGEQAEHLERYKAVPSVPMGPFHKNRPAGLYRHMFLPIAHYGLKGVLWYQGENDDHHPEMYAALFARLTARWRSMLEDSSLPFLCAQLAPFERWMALGGERFPIVREQQNLACKTIPGCYLTSTMDIGMRFDIHPKEKKELGRRFFLLAADKIYGMHRLSEPPEAVYAEKRGNTQIAIRFLNCGDGLRITDDVLPLFSVIQNNREKELLSAAVCGDELEITAGALTREPVTINFAQMPYECVSLYNSAGLPAKPFRITVKP